MPARVSDATVVVKLIREPGEIEYYSDLVSRHHYLASSQINRNTIVHVARQGKRDVAVLTWEPAVRRWFGKRDRLIGWTEHQREQRLKYCVENRRFLMLSEEKNLASKVLSLSIERLGKDGQETHGHDFLIAETFIDPTRGYDGTCYKAAGWTEAGLTQGGRGKDDRSKKLYFLKELKLNALAKLKAPELTPSDTKNPRQSVLNLERLDLQSLRRRLDAIPDRRKHKGWYPMTSIYALMIVSVLCGETTAKGMWRWISELSRELLRSLGCRQAPSYSMIWSSLRDADHAALQEALCGWLTEQGNRLYVDRSIRILSLDGKALRSASKAAGTELHVLTLIDTVAKTLRAQRPVDAKTNEIPVAQELLAAEPLNAETVVTADAMHTQEKLAETLVKKTLITSSRSKTISQTSEKRLSTRRRQRFGRYRTVLQSLDTDV
jgi:hypothetical protein